MRNGTQLLFLNLRYLVKSCKFNSRVIYSRVVFGEAEQQGWAEGASTSKSVVYHNGDLFVLPNFDMDYAASLTVQVPLSSRGHGTAASQPEVSK